MFTTGTESGDVDPQSRYGEPQHEDGTWDGWENEYYGDASGQDSSTDIEYVPGIEYSPRSDAGISSPNRRGTPSSLTG
ncbi:hypothetical protein HacjB3_00790 [Halalkalicoccus jeotgali B3]|uniref:Uncharacterized protein n=1 Tax=Halalkalicoccus jeotgali (strain DSM 18796 / CECT 7217 / JCM 14584 / KCTC 4019 / B3) TaxID=795797 RepID=D8J4I9_HALJB|nr:hypothetical protein HacjB3_00790 [Halalkalicoccus jeotgali B3]